MTFKTQMSSKLTFNYKFPSVSEKSVTLSSRGKRNSESLFILQKRAQTHLHQTRNYKFKIYKQFYNYQQ